jgi:hypothetical protein
MATKRRCTATTKTGKPCRRRPAPGTGRCAVHAGDQLDGLTPDVHQEIVHTIELGAPRELAAEAAGISRATLFRWLSRGETDDAPERFRKLADDVHRASARGAVRSLLEIQRDESGGWQRHKWLLAVRYPEHFTERGRLEHTGPEDGPIDIEMVGDALGDLRRLSEAQLDELGKLMEITHGG